MCSPDANAVRRVAAALSVLLLSALLAGPVAARDTKLLKCVALIIGQSGYLHVAARQPGQRPARAVDKLLISLGFDTRAVGDRDSAKLKHDLERFAEDAEGVDVALLHYSGHGIEAGGENYLVPTDADPQALDNARERLASLSEVMERLNVECHRRASERNTNA